MGLNRKEELLARLLAFEVLASIGAITGVVYDYLTFQGHQTGHKQPAVLGVPPGKCLHDFVLAAALARQHVDAGTRQ